MSDKNTILWQHVECVLTNPPYGETRPEQLEVAQAIAKVLSLRDPQPGTDAPVLKVEAETGVGKTAAYLAPILVNAALTTGERGLVSTFTINLSAQVQREAEGIAQTVEQITGKKLVICRRLGRRNFVDVERVAKLLQELRRSGAPTETIKMLEHWLGYAADPTASGLIQEAMQQRGLEISPGLRREDLCLTQISGDKAAKNFKAHVEDTHYADLIITSHAMCLIDALRWGHVMTDADQAAKPVKVAVFDEADKLTDAAEGLTGCRIRLTEIPGLDPAVLAQARALLPSGDQAVEMDATRHAEFVDLIERNKDRLPSEVTVWIDAGRSPGVFHATVEPAPDADKPALTALALYPARLLSRLYAGSRILRSAVFTSATLGAIEYEVKAQNVVARIKVAPRRFGDLDFVLSGDCAPTPMQDGEPTKAWLDFAAQGIQSAHAAGGRTLVLAASYTDAEALGRRLGDLPHLLVHLRGRPLDTLLRDYRADDRAVLISPAAWEGVNLPSMVNQLVIPRIPFPPPERAREAVLGRSQAHRSVQRGHRKLKQGIGRALRRQSDKATLWVLDPRFPLPPELTADPTRGVYSSDGRPQLMKAVPTRFTRGPFSKYSQARVISDLLDPRAA